MLTLALPVAKRYDRLAGMIARAEAGSLRPDRFVIVDNTGGLSRLVEEGKVSLPAGRTLVVDPGRNLGVAASWNLILRENPYPTVIVGLGLLMGVDSLRKLVGLIEGDALFAHGEPGKGGMYGFFLHTPGLTELVGPYDEAYWPAYYEDTDYVRRMAARGVLAGGRSRSLRGDDSIYEPGSTHDVMPPEERQAFIACASANREHYKAKWGGHHYQETRTEPADAPRDLAQLRASLPAYDWVVERGARCDRSF